MALATVAAGQEILAAHHNSIVNALTGAAQQTFSFNNSDASSYTLTLKNSNANNRTLKLLKSDGTVDLEHNEWGTWFPRNVAIGTTIEHLAESLQKPLLVSKSTGDAAYQLVSFEYGNHYAGSSPVGDVVCLRLVNDIETGTVGTIGTRAAEIHTRMFAGGGALTGHAAADFTLCGPDDSGDTVYNNIITLQVLGASNAVSGPARMDNAIYIGHDDEGVKYGIRYIGTAGEGYPELFRADQNGIAQARGVRPMADVLYDLGSGSLRWNDIWSVRTLAGSGSASVPGHSFTGDTDTGLFQGTTDVIDATTGGTIALRIDANGLLDFKRTGTQFVALGGGAGATLGTIGGSGPAAAGQRSWLKIMEDGTADFVPVWR